MNDVVAKRFAKLSEYLLVVGESVIVEDVFVETVHIHQRNEVPHLFLWRAARRPSDRHAPLPFTFDRNGLDQLAAFVAVFMNVHIYACLMCLPGQIASNPCRNADRVSFSLLDYPCHRVMCVYALFGLRV